MERWIVYKIKNRVKYYLAIDSEETTLTTDESKAYKFNYYDYASLYLREGFCVEKVYI